MEQFEVTFRTWYKQASDYRPPKARGEEEFPGWYECVFANGRPVEGVGFSVALDDEVPDQWEARAVLLVWAETEEEANDPAMTFNQVGLLHDQLASRAVDLLGYDIEMGRQWLIDDEATRPSIEQAAGRSLG